MFVTSESEQSITICTNAENGLFGTVHREFGRRGKVIERRGEVAATQHMASVLDSLYHLPGPNVRYEIVTSTAR